MRVEASDKDDVDATHTLPVVSTAMATDMSMSVWPVSTFAGAVAHTVGLPVPRQRYTLRPVSVWAAASHTSVAVSTTRARLEYVVSPAPVPLTEATDAGGHAATSTAPQ